MKKLVLLIVKSIEYLLVITVVALFSLYYLMGVVKERFIHPKLENRSHPDEIYEFDLKPGQSSQHCVSVHINHSGPYLLELDSGSPFMVLKLSVASKLDLDQVWQSVAAKDLNKNYVPEDAYFMVNSMQVGDLHFQKINILAEKKIEGSGCDGLLPISFFKDFLTTIDLKNNKIILEKDKKLTRDKNTISYQTSNWWIKELFRRVKTHIKINLNYVEREQITQIQPFYFDTGASGVDFMVNHYHKNITAKRNVATMRADFPFYKVEDIQYNIIVPNGYFQAPQSDLKLTGNLQILAKKFPRDDVTIPNIIGNNFMKHYKIILDQKNKLIRFIPN